MKNKNFAACAGAAILSSLLTLAAVGTSRQTSAQTPQTANAEICSKSNAVQYQLGAVLYMQKAAEYRALAYQAFNLARKAFDADFEKKNLRSLTKAERKLPRAVVVDVDETVLDNSPQQASLILREKNYNSADWTAWTAKRTAKPIPGAVDFLKYAHQRGARIFYVTNRRDNEKQSTIENLINVGFPDVSAETVMTRSAEASKENRRREILKTHRIVLLVGDNLNDLAQIFEEKSVADRFAATDQMRDMFGRKFIVLPNAMYGDWENAIYKYERNLSDEQRISARAAALETIQ